MAYDTEESKMINLIARTFVILLAALIGALWPPIHSGGWLEPASGALLGAAVALILIGGVSLLEQGTPGMIFGGLSGFVLAAWLATIVNSLIFGGMAAEQASAWGFVRYVVIVSFAVSGLAFGVQRGKWLTPINIKTLFAPGQERRRYKILDTSVIIDGRIADICETGFLDGTLVVPKFVLKELQQIADSSHSLKRNRGRRGLEILHKIQQNASVNVIVSEKDFPDVPEVDMKLIEMARLMGGKIVTNDFNLNKVAQLRGVEVLNINELANALKPVVLPGELMRVFVLKEGKEANQGIGYLDDGTMIVVDNAQQLIGRTVDLVVTSVLQTTAGKMIFGRTEEDGSLPDMPIQQRNSGARRPNGRRG
jgi:uncharacterized protein YacL